MTKYEWESELKKNIHRMPEDEIKRVVEYYNELFEDKIERGLDERDIIAEFGNPVDVADKILSEYGDTVKDNTGTPTHKAEIYDASAVKAQKSIPSTDVIAPSVAFSNTADKVAPQQQLKTQAEEAVQTSNKSVKSSGKVSGGRLAVFIVFLVLLGGAFFGIAVAAWAALVAVIASGGACLVAGIVWVIPTFGLFAGGFASALVQMGCCLIISGVGALLIIVGVKLIKVSVRVTRASFKGMKNFLVVKRGEAYEN